MAEQVVVPDLKEPNKEELCAPFERHDVFGEHGKGPLSWQDRSITILEAILLFPLRAVAAFLCVIVYWLICKASSFLAPTQRAAIAVPAGKIACRSALFCLGFIRIRWVVLPNPPNTPRPGGIVSTHGSYLDILIHMADSFPAFVARKSTRDVPFIGIISQMMSCLYVDRNRSGPNHVGVSDMVKERMEVESEGHTGAELRPLLLFPEGTTSNGIYMLPFKTGAFLAGVPVQPVVIQYHHGRLWPTWETIPVMRHLFLLMCQPANGVTFIKLPVYVPNAEERADPKLYAQNVRQHMMEIAGSKDTVAVFEDKMRYLNHLRRKYGEKVPKKIQ